jgi:hypothetical protein
MQLTVLLMAEPGDAPAIPLLRVCRPAIVRAAAAQALADAELAWTAFCDDEALGLVASSEVAVLRNILAMIDAPLLGSAEAR